MKLYNETSDVSSVDPMIGLETSNSDFLNGYVNSRTIASTEENSFSNYISKYQAEKTPEQLKQEREEMIARKEQQINSMIGGGDVRSPTASLSSPPNLKDPSLDTVSPIRIIGGGITDAAQDVVNTYHLMSSELAKHGFDKLPDVGRQEFAQDMFPPSNNPVENSLRKVTSFIAKYGAASGAITAAGGSIGVLGGTALGGAISLTEDAQDENLANLVNDTFLGNPVTEYLSAKKEDSEPTKRLKQALIDMGIAGSIEAVMAGFSHARAKLRFKVEESKALTESTGTVIEKSASGDVIKTTEGTPIINVPLDEGNVPTVIGSEPPAVPGKLPPTPDQPPAIPLMSDYLTPSERISLENRISKKSAKASEKFPMSPETRQSIQEGAGAPPNNPYPKYVANRNMFTVEEDARETVYQLVKSNPDLFIAAKGGVRSWEKIGKDAADIETEKVLDKLFSLSPTKAPLTEGEQFVAMHLEAAAVDRFIDVAKKYNAGDVSKEVFDNVTNTTQLLMAMNAAEGSITARKLGLRRMVAKQSSVATEDRKALLDMLGMAGNSEELAKNIAELGPTNVKKALKQSLLGPTGDYLGSLWDAVLEVKVNAMLAGKTFFLNPLSNVIALTGDVTATMGARAITILKNSGRDFEGEAGAMIDGIYNDLNTATAYAKLHWKRGQSSLDTLEKYAADRRNAISSKKLLPFINSADTTVIGRLIDKIGYAIRSPSRALGAQDDFFKSLSKTATEYKFAQKQSVKTGEPRGVILDRWYKTNVPASVSARASEAMRKNTYNQEVEGFAKYIYKLGTNIPMIGRVMNPFLRTPLNITNRGLEHTPLALMFPGFVPSVREAWARGGRDRIMVQSRIVLGSSILGLGAYLGTKGLITGDEAGNKGIAQIQRDKGFKKYHVQLPGGRQMPLDDLGWPGQALKLGVGLAQVVPRDERDEPMHGEMVQAAALMLGYQVAPESIIDSLAGVFDLISTGDTKVLETLTEGFTGGFVPPAVDAITKTVDPTKRIQWNNQSGIYGMFEESLNKMKARIPGFSEELPADINFFGRDVMHAPGILNGRENDFVEMGGADNDVTDELIRLGSVYPAPIIPEGDNVAVYLKKPSRKVTVGSVAGVPQQYELSPEEYRKYVLNSNGLDEKGRELEKGVSLEKELRKTIKSKEYAQYTDDKKALVLKSIVAKFHANGNKMLRTISPALDKLLNNASKVEKNIEGKPIRIRGE